MKRSRSWKVGIVLLGCLMLGWIFVHAQALSFAPPFVSTPFIPAYTATDIDGGFRFFGRHHSERNL